MRKLLILITAILAIGSIMAESAGHDKRHAKARHFMIESASKQMTSDVPSAYELAKRAYRIDPQYSEAAFNFGLYHLVINLDSTQEYADGLGLMRRYVDSHPDDYIAARRYSSVATQLGNLNEARRIYERNESIFPEKSADLINLANVYIGLGEFDNALSTISRYENLEGKNAMLTLHKISMLLDRKDTAGAIRQADELIAFNPTIAPNYLVKGNTYLFIGATDSARKYLEQAERVDPESSEAKVALASFWLSQGDSAKYDTKIYEALMANGSDLQDKMGILINYMANLLKDKSNSERAANLFKTLTDQYPHEPEVMWLASEYSAVKNDYDDAAEKISFAIDMEPDNTGYWEKLMQYHIGGDRFAEVENDYNRASAKIKPTDGMDYLLAGSYQMDEKYDKALDVYDRLLKEVDSRLGALDSLHSDQLKDSIPYDMRGRVSSLYTSAGDALQLKRDTTATFQAYGNAILFYPDNTLALNNYAYLLAESGGDLNEAERMSRKTIQLEEENPIYLDTYAWILFKQGEYRMALPYQAVAVEKSVDEPSSELYEHYGDILFMAGEPDQALDNWKKALELSPDREILQRKVKNKAYFYE